mgnify:FL=1
MISRFEKAVLIILAGLGAGWWGIGLLLALSIPGEYNFNSNRNRWFLWMIENGVPVSCFLIYGWAILKNRITKRHIAWPLLLIIIIGAILFTYLFETWLGTPNPSL